jgi:hypothetical protein
MLLCALGRPLVPTGAAGSARSNARFRSKLSGMLVRHEARTGVEESNCQSHMCKPWRGT